MAASLQVVACKRVVAAAGGRGRWQRQVAAAVCRWQQQMVAAAGGSSSSRWQQQQQQQQTVFGLLSPDVQVHRAAHLPPPTPFPQVRNTNINLLGIGITLVGLQASGASRPLINRPAAWLPRWSLGCRPQCLCSLCFRGSKLQLATPSDLESPLALCSLHPPTRHHSPYPPTHPNLLQWAPWSPRPCSPPPTPPTRSPPPGPP